MGKITQYSIITSANGQAAIVADVAHAIENGWQPLGGICTSSNTTGGTLLQVIVKYED